MPTDQVQQARLVGIEQAISRRIAERTAGQIRSLEVEVLGDHIVIRGYASSYYQKQLALQSVLDATAAGPGGHIDCNIEVVRRPSTAAANARRARARKRRA